jgi:hypothetical protein
MTRMPAVTHRQRSILRSKGAAHWSRPSLATLQAEYDAHTGQVEQLKREIESQVKRIAAAEGAVNHLRGIGRQMTEEQWRKELAAALTGTEWVSAWSGITQKFPCCLADVRHRTTSEFRPVSLSRDAFRNPETRKAEVLRQLSR